MKLTRRQRAIINAMKYLAIKNKDIVFRCDPPNQYRQSWYYCIWTNKDGIAVDIERFEVPV
jgi:hypothetical protein